RDNDGRARSAAAAAREGHGARGREEDALPRRPQPAAAGRDGHAGADRERAREAGSVRGSVQVPQARNSGESAHGTDESAGGCAGDRDDGSFVASVPAFSGGGDHRGAEGRRCAAVRQARLGVAGCARRSPRTARCEHGQGGLVLGGVDLKLGTFADETIELFEVISISAGARGTQILLPPADYLRATRAKVGPIAR